MKWLVVVFCFVAYAESSVIKCSPGAGSSCKTEDAEKEAPMEFLPEVSAEATELLEAECLPGSKWRSNCYDCVCSSTGTAICGKLADCHLDVDAEPVRCAPNTKFARDCNTCVCLESGLGLCTMKSCRTSIISKKSDLGFGKECASGSSWMSQCNQCTCSPSGYPYCTLKDCPMQKSEPIKKCAPDTVWNDGCNTCWCSQDGSRAMCTLMECKVIQLNETTEQTKTTADQAQETSIEYVEEIDTPGIVNSKDPKTTKDEHDNTITDKEHSFEELQQEITKLDNNIVNKRGLYEHDNFLGLGETDPYHTVLKRSVCKANEIFQSECNTCKCSPDGQTYTCTHNECMEGNQNKEVDKNKEVEVFMESEDEDHIERHSVCKPRGTFYIGCNTCHCNQYGTDYSCTNKPCPLPEDVELFHELRATKSAKNETQKVVCVANRMFIKDCNTCWCNEDGTSFFCTRRVCVPDLPEEGTEEERPEELRVIKKECRPDEVFELDCNMCRCNPDGKSFSCTRRACVEPIDEENKNLTLSRKTRGVKEEPPKTCLPGQEFRLDCNKCLCDNEGQDFSCTRNDCNALNGAGSTTRTKRDTSTSETVDMKCVAGSVFDRDCNVCRCTDDGNHAVCTIKQCVASTSERRDGNDLDSSVRESETDDNFRCNPGDQFKRDCNDCTCSADGKSVFCTIRLCDQDLGFPI